ncbi:MAG: hypothetical protein AAB955_01840 [Patescibacteria group bacterium]
MVTLYNVVSEDGYIARTDGSEDFIPDELWEETLRVYKQFDTLVMGRRTYEVVQTYPPELTEPLQALGLRMIVVTRDTDFVLPAGYEVVNTPEEAVTLGTDVLVCTGPTLNNYLLENGLVQQVIHHQVAVTLGEGIPVFDDAYRARLVLESESDLEFARELIYRVAGDS